MDAKERARKVCGLLNDHDASLEPEDEVVFARAIEAAEFHARISAFAEAVEMAAGIIAYERDAIGSEDAYARRVMSRTCERVLNLMPEVGEEPK